MDALHLSYRYERDICSSGLLGVGAEVARSGYRPTVVFPIKSCKGGNRPISSTQISYRCDGALDTNLASEEGTVVSEILQWCHP